MYNALAEFYDAFMNDVDYPKWTEFLKSFIGARKKGADIGCGTGKITLLLKAAGFDVFGMDVSPQMLNVAKAQAQKKGISAEFVLGDMQTSALPELDFVTAVCDTVNYIKNPQKAFCNVFSALKEGGVFIFDISSEYKLEQILGCNTYSDNRGDITYIWHNYLNKKLKRVEMELTFFKKVGELYEKTTENQVQYIHKTIALIDMLKNAGFDNISVYGDYTAKPPDPLCERINFVACKHSAL